MDLLLRWIRSLFVTRPVIVDDSRERAVEVFWILNDFIGDLIGGTRSFEYFDALKFKVGATDQVQRFYYKMADSFLFLTLAKWIEFYDRYKILIPQEMLPSCRELRSELEKRGVREFRNMVVGHIWSKKRSRPLLPSEIEQIEKKITKGDATAFLKWINDPAGNGLGRTVVGTSEAVRDAIRMKWYLSEQELSQSRA